MIAPTVLNSACYEGTIRHRRHGPQHNSFTYKLFMAYLDLNELPKVFQLSSWWKLHKPGFARFVRKDYLGPRDIPLDRAVRLRVEQEGHAYPTGPIRMLTHLRYAGYCFNPVTFYYGFADDGKQLEWILAEITNTPWNERHSYFLPVLNNDGPRQWEFEKAFHVSPFNGMDQGYRWNFSNPGQQLTVHMVNTEAGKDIFDATLVLKRHRMTGRKQQQLLLRHPALTIAIIFRIHWQALKLWWKRVPFHQHPAKAVHQPSHSRSTQ